MSLHTLQRQQFLPIEIQTAWGFFSSPGNLNKITPPNMGFDILSGFNEREKMYPGMIIEYHVSPFAGLKLHWVTEITHVQEPYYFVDEQRHGPYALWHHRHLFKEVEGGVLMTDIVCYRPPLGALGDIMNTLVIRKKVESIFAHRKNVLEAIFPGGKQ